LPTTTMHQAQLDSADHEFREQQLYGNDGWVHNSPCGIVAFVG